MCIPLDVCAICMCQVPMEAHRQMTETSLWQLGLLFLFVYGLLLIMCIWPSLPGLTLFPS